MKRITVFDNEIRKNTLLNKYLTDINVLDDIITESMIHSEEKIKKSKFIHYWYPQLAVSILQVTLWEIYLSTVRNKKNKQHVIWKIVKKTNSFDDQTTPPNIDSNDKRHITYELKLALKNLKQIKRDETTTMKTHLISRSQEVDITENTKLSFFILRLITIEK